MSDLGPYQDDPYAQIGPAGPGFPPSQDYPASGYYGSPEAVQAGVPGPAPYAQHGGLVASYGGPYQQAGPYGPYNPYVAGGYGAGLYDPRRYEANSLGGWALGLGIVSLVSNFWCLIGLLFGIPAIIVGVMGVNAANEGRASNKGMSIAGLVTGSVGTIISVAGIAFLVYLINIAE